MGIFEASPIVLLGLNVPVKFYPPRSHEQVSDYPSVSRMDLHGQFVGAPHYVQW
ncbi:hypothetical protein D3C75_1368630 [compost metagenome]